MTSIREPVPDPAGRAAAPTRIRAPMVEPAEDARLDRLPRWAGYPLAVVAPLVMTLALIPFRESMEQGAALVLILPVVLVALVAGPGPAVLGALVAGGSFAVFLTVPFGQFQIDRGVDVVATVVLLVVAVVVGLTAVRGHRLARRADLRADELNRLVDFAESSAGATGGDGLVDQAADHLRVILSLTDVEWHPGAPPDGPVLLADGEMMGYLSELGADRRRLPAAGIALPVGDGDRTVGWFRLVPGEGTTSIEQRRTASAIANLLAVALTRPSVSPG